MALKLPFTNVVIDPHTGKMTRVWQRAFEAIAEASGFGGEGTVWSTVLGITAWRSVTTLIGAAALAWSQIDKTGSSLADLSTRSAADLSSGTLNDARLSANVSLFGTSVPWANVDTTGSSLADLATRSAADLNSGTLDDARLSANVILKTVATFTVPVRLTPVAFAALPAGAEGMIASVNDSNTATWAATIAGGGANKVLAYYNGTNWVVAAA